MDQDNEYERGRQSEEEIKLQQQIKEQLYQDSSESKPSQPHTESTSSDEDTHIAPVDLKSSELLFKPKPKEFRHKTPVQTSQRLEVTKIKRPVSHNKKTSPVKDSKVLLAPRKEAWKSDDYFGHPSDPAEDIPKKYGELGFDDEIDDVGSDGIVKLNIGGKLFWTTKTTLFSRGMNFFFPLLNGKIQSFKDENGAFFIDRNGRYFEPILDFLRYGELIIPPNIPTLAVLREACFYSIDIAPGMCGLIKEGLYTSSHWIIFLERDPHHPWRFGITGVEDSKESKNVFFKQVCFVKQSVIEWSYNDAIYEIFSSDNKVFLWNPKSFASKTQLFFRCPNSPLFPLLRSETLSTADLDGESLIVSFKAAVNGEILAKTFYQKESFSSTIEVLCRRLLIMHQKSDEERRAPVGGSSPETAVNPLEPKKQDKSKSKSSDWLLYIHSDLAFFAFGHQYLEFGASLQKRPLKPT